jgi:dTDP-4-amino-4,6-dideoxygalactose transaminase
MDVAAAHGIAVVEDCAQAAGASYKGKRVGTFGVMGAFSFYPTKVLGAFGDGGLVTTSEDEICQRLRRLRFYGIASDYYAEEEGYNSRLDEVQAALLDFRLNKLDSDVGRRRDIAAAYDEGLAGIVGLSLPVEKNGRKHQYYLYTIRTPQRDALQAYLAASGIETRINYPTPVHLMRGYRFLGYEAGSLPVTERLSGEILSLPMYPQLTHQEVARVIDVVCGFFRG